MMLGTAGLVERSSVVGALVGVPTGVSAGDGAGEKGVNAIRASCMCGCGRMVDPSDLDGGWRGGDKKRSEISTFDKICSCARARARRGWAAAA
jgi:hypothetical protein